MRGSARHVAPLTCSPELFCHAAVGQKKCTAQCSDGVDNNNGGGIDYPNDPSCTSPTDDTEVNVVCPGAACPACSNTIDDDGDTKPDYPMDFGCSPAGGTTEVFCAADVDYGGSLTQPTTMGTLAAPAADNFDQSCQMNTGNDKTWLLSLPVPVAKVTITTDGSVAGDTVLSLRDASCVQEVQCDDDGGDGLQSKIERSVPAGNYAIVVDGFSTSNDTDVTINVKGTVAAGTSCSSALFVSGLLVCPTGTSCTNNVCQ